MHFLHLSTAGSIELVRQAKAEGLPVTAEAAPHHFASTTPWWRVMTRSSGQPAAAHDGRRRCRQSRLVDGTIDAVATDHAPHAPETKDAPFDQAPQGCSGSSPPWRSPSPSSAGPDGPLSAREVLALSPGVRRHRPSRPER